MVENRSFKAQFAILKPYLRPQFSPLLGVFCAILIATVCDLLFARYLGLTLDGALAESWQSFLGAFKWLLAVWFVNFLVMHLRYLWANGAAERVVFSLRQEVADKLGTVASEELERRHSGDYVSRLSSDTDLIRGLVAANWSSLVAGTIGAVAALVYMLIVSWKVTLFSIALTPLIMVVSGVLSKPLSKVTKELQAKLADVNSLAQDVTGGITVSKAFLLKNYLSPRFRDRASGAADAAVELAYQNGRLQAAMMILSIAPFFILFGVGGYEVIQGRMTPGSLMVMLNLLNKLTWPLQSTGRSLAQVKAALSASERIFELLELPCERKEGLPLLKPADHPYAIEMRGVEFSYGDQRTVFSDLNLDIKQGETVAIVGPSGTGKTTLFSLLLGLRNPQAGQISYYGQPMQEVSLADLRQAIAYVAQEALLFPTSIAENIGYGRADATRAEIEAAAREAYADQFIQRLPNGYDTLLGELGTGLSGGQKQRLSLARAILKDAPILLLDEATSALDTEAEAKVQAAIESLAEDRTTLVIAHRLSTILNADRIVVIDQGRVVEEGSHEELLAAGKTYAGLYASQFGPQKTAVAVAGQ